MVETMHETQTGPPGEPPRRPFRWAIVALFLGLLLLGGVVGVQALVGALRGMVGGVSDEPGADVPPGQSVVVDVPPGASARAIGELLAEQGVVSSSLQFELAVRGSDAQGQLKAGRYELVTGMDEADVIELLVAGPAVETFWVIIREGLWVSEIIAALAEQTPHDVEDFEDALLSGNIRSGLLPDEPQSVQDWEGLLFPDTYEFRMEATPEDILSRLAETMERRVDSVDWSRLEELGVDQYEAIIVASLIEGETRLNDERPLVASVVYNRIDQGMPLEIDATVLYAVGRRGSGPTRSELESDSPYNTRRFGGLPPTPIGAPGLASLRAAADPADTDHLFYVLVSRSGEHFFTADYDEFLQRKAQAQEEGVIP